MTAPTVQAVNVPQRVTSPLVAKVVLLSFGLHLPGLGLVTVGGLLGVVSLPFLWKPAQRILDTKSVRRLVFAAMAAVLSGWLLRLVVLPTTGTSSPVSEALQISLWVVAFPAMFVLGGLALTSVGPRSGLLWLVTGMLAGNSLYYGFASGNPWKYTLSFPVGLLVFAIVGSLKPRSRLLPLAAGVILAAISFSFDSRSAGTAALLAGVASVVQPKRQGGGKAAVVSVALVSALTAFLVSQAMVAGYFGTSIQRTIAEQTANGQRNLILGGRTETNASALLAQEHPLGYGMAVVPAPALQQAAMNNALAQGGNNTTGYFQTSIFAERVDLHSMATDLWFHAGLGGVVLALVVVLTLLSGLLRQSGSLMRPPRSPVSARSGH